MSSDSTHSWPKPPTARRRFEFLYRGLFFRNISHGSYFSVGEDLPPTRTEHDPHIKLPPPVPSSLLHNTPEHPSSGHSLPVCMNEFWSDSSFFIGVRGDSFRDTLSRCANKSAIDIKGLYVCLFPNLLDFLVIELLSVPLEFFP